MTLYQDLMKKTWGSRRSSLWSVFVFLYVTVFFIHVTLNKKKEEQKQLTQILQWKIKIQFPKLVS